MQTPGLNKKAEAQLLVATPHAIKPLAELAIVLVHKSLFLYRSYQVIYVFFSLGFIVALMPWLLANFWWWLVGGAILLLLWWCYLWQVAGIFHGQFWYEQGRWHLRSDLVSGRGKLSGDVVCWPMLIILPVRDDYTGRKLHLVICRDALSEADNARLRTWLRVSLRPKA